VLTSKDVNMKKTKKHRASSLFMSIQSHTKTPQKMTYTLINKQLRLLLNDDSHYCVLGYN
jgi:hypothetical protein